MQQLQTYVLQNKGISNQNIKSPTRNEIEDFTARIVCYYNSSAIRRPLFGYFNFANISTDVCNHIVYVAGNLDANNWKISFQEYTSSLNSDITNLKKKSTGLKFLLLVQGNDEAFSLMAGNTLRRRLFTGSLVKWVRQFGFDGVVLDWKLPASHDILTYITLLQEIRQSFAPDSILVNVVLHLPSSKQLLMNSFDIHRLKLNVDSVYVRPFSARRNADFTDILVPLRRRSADHRNKSNMLDGLKILVDAGIPKHKILFGLSFQGVSYTLASRKYHALGSPVKRWLGGGFPGAYTQTRGLLSYYEICTSIYKGRLNRSFDFEGMSPYAHKDDQWIAYEDADSISLKATVVRNQGYGGVFVSSVDMDDFRSFCGESNPLLKAVKTVLDGYTVRVDDVDGLDDTSSPYLTTATTSTPGIVTIPTQSENATNVSTYPPAETVNNSVIPAIASLIPAAVQTLGTILKPSSITSNGVNVFIPNNIAINCTTETRKYIAHPVFCGRYYQCIHGIAFAKECPDGLHWNSEISNCDWPASSSRPLCI
ncbi:CHIA (predicted) [Pycnogonum litorale]